MTSKNTNNYTSSHYLLQTSYQPQNTKPENSFHQSKETDLAWAHFPSIYAKSVIFAENLRLISVEERQTKSSMKLELSFELPPLKTKASSPSKWVKENLQQSHWSFIPNTQIFISKSRYLLDFSKFYFKIKVNLHMCMI